MSDTEIVDETPKDNSTALATALIILTTVVLLAAVVIVNGVTSKHYGAQEAMF